MAAEFDPISLEILWSRLIAIVDEASATLYRTSFSPVVRESNDYACVLFDACGNSLAQSSLSIPSFIGTLPVTVRHLLRCYPAETLQPGDVLVTNDPWLGTGHLNDINIAVPIFSRGRLVAIAASTAHAPDIGGRLLAPDNREVFEEGLRIPVTKLVDAGQRNDLVFEFVSHNVRVPEQVIGDVEAQIAANRLAAARLAEFMEEYELADLAPLANAIQEQSEQAARAAIRQIPAGTYRQRLTVDGLDDVLEICLALTVDHERGRIVCDYTGTSPQQPAAYNVVPNYAYAFTAFAVKCVVVPEIPNNEGSFRPVVVTAPEGSLLNPRFPAAVGVRSLIGHYLPVLVFNALAEVVPERVRAAAGSPNWAVVVSGQREGGGGFAGIFFASGGMGGARGQDGISAICFPSNAANTPLEVLEHFLPLTLLRHELRTDSAGAGQWRGGLGQTLELEVEATWPVSLALWTSHTQFAPSGLCGGRPGALGTVLLNDQPIDAKYQRLIHHGDRLTAHLPGGGGFGPAARRDPDALRADVVDGLVSAEAVACDYGKPL